MTSSKQTPLKYPTLLMAFMMALPILVGASSPACVSARIPLESAWAGPVEAQDVTAVVEGCGHMPIVGYTYCRVQAGEDALHKSLVFLAPPAKCGATACAFLRVFDSSGTLVLGESFEKGSSRLEIPWTKLLLKDTFETGARGIYLFFIEVHSTNPDGNDQVSFSEGEIRLRVVSPSVNGLPYRGLDRVKDDASFVWRWTDKKRNLLVQWTQKLRASAFPLKELE